MTEAAKLLLIVTPVAIYALACLVILNESVPDSCCCLHAAKLHSLPAIFV